MCCWDWGELCEQGRSPATPSGGIYSSVLTGRACPAPTNPPLTSAVRRGTPIRLTFLNHARYPLRLFLVGGSLAELVLLGTLGANGQTLRVAAADSFAWTLKAYSGVTVHQVAPERGAPSRTVNVRECDVSGGRRKMRLHAGW